MGLSFEHRIPFVCSNEMSFLPLLVQMIIHSLPHHSSCSLPQSLRLPDGDALKALCSLYVHTNREQTTPTEGRKNSEKDSKPVFEIEICHQISFFMPFILLCMQFYEISLFRLLLIFVEFFSGLSFSYDTSIPLIWKSAIIIVSGTIGIRFQFQQKMHSLSSILLSIFVLNICNTTLSFLFFA